MADRNAFPHGVLCAIGVAASLFAPAAIAAPQSPPAGGQPRGNGLWAIQQLESLTATRERPLFMPSRRPPPVAVVAPPAPTPAPPPSEPERFRLSLIGTVVAASDGMAVFLDKATKKVILLRTGQSHAGWVLRAVKGREATVERDRETIHVALLASEATSPPLQRARDTTAGRIRIAAVDGGSGAPAPPPAYIGQASPAVAVPVAAMPVDGSPAPPASIAQASPAVGMPHGAPADGSPMPPPFIDQASAAVTASGVTLQSLFGQASPAVAMPGATATSDGAASPAPPPFLNRASPATNAPASSLLAPPR